MTNHWTTLVPPLAPSDEDVQTYANLIVGDKVMLLGSTFKLLSLSTVAYDIEPQYPVEKIHKSDWLDIEDVADTVLADGCLALDRTLSDALLTKFQHQCKRFIARTFNRRLDGMKYATFFPTTTDFNIMPTSSLVLEDYSFHVWDFK
jgi:hypothetical protein